MKRLFQKILAMGCIALLALTLSVPAFAADAAVTYEGRSEQFVFTPGSSHSPTDLFDGFKDVMPGDTRTQALEIRNDVKNNVKIKLYVRSLGAEEGSEAFLSQLKLTVKQDGGSELFAAPADETARLADWVYLGTVYSGGEIKLNLTLDVPAALGDEFQNAVGYVNWQFKAEELPVEETDPKPPQTGEHSNPGLWLSLAGASLLVILLLLYRRRKSEQA